jgi:hypothetical protein
MGLVPQSEVNKQTRIVNRHYSDAEWAQFTPAEKQKIWQLRNPGKTPETGPTRHDRRRAVASTLTLSTSPSGPSKCPMEDPTVKSDKPADDKRWGRNREDPFLSCQVRPHGNDNRRAKSTNKTLDRTVKWTPDLTQTILTLKTFRQHIYQQPIVNNVRYKLDGIYETTLELDSHDDTCVLGRGALIILDYNRPVSVVGYDESLGSKTYQTAYDDPQTRRTLHLIINQAIHIPHIDHHLLCPMQCCVNDVTVNDLPEFLAVDSTDQTHALTLTDPNNPLQLIILPLILRGVTSLLNVRSVTINEFNSHDHLRLHLTSETLTWDPMTDLYERQENAMMDYSGNIIHDAAVRRPNLIPNELQSLTTDLADLTHDCNFHQVLTAHVVVSSVNSSLSGHVRSRKTVSIDFMTLASRWMIALDRAKKTVQQTTQRGVRTCLNPTLS